MKNFSLREMTRSETAEKQNIQNLPKDTEMENMVFVMHELQNVRDYFYDRPIIVTSGFRSKELNKAVGGAANSLHMKGKAADIQPVVKGNGEMGMLAYAVEARMSMDSSMISKVILEDVGGRKWIHVEVEREQEKLKEVLWIQDGVLMAKVDECDSERSRQTDKMISRWASA